MSKGLLKLAIGVAAAGVAVKIGRDKYKSKKRQYEEEELESAGDPIKKYTAFFDRKLVEIPAGPFEGCELKAFSSKLILDLSRAEIVKDVYISFSAKGSTISIVTAKGVSVVTDISESLSKVKNHSEKKEKDKPVIYLIGNAIGSTIEVIPENVYLDDDEAEEDMDMKEFMENASEA